MDADGRTRTLQRNLQEAQDQLKNIKRGAGGAAAAPPSAAASRGRAFQRSRLLFVSNSDDIRDMIDEAKRKAASANRTASDTMDKVNAIKQEVDKIGGVAPGGGNLNKVLKDVDTSSETQGLF